MVDKTKYGKLKRIRISRTCTLEISRPWLIRRARLFKNIYTRSSEKSRVKSVGPRRFFGCSVIRIFPSSLLGRPRALCTQQRSLPRPLRASTPSLSPFLPLFLPSFQTGRLSSEIKARRYIMKLKFRSAFLPRSLRSRIKKKVKNSPSFWLQLNQPIFFPL